jgi:nucleoside-diphosphate-sugar epimerase
MASLEKAFKGIDVVVNLAAELHDAGKFQATNIQGTHNVIALAKAHGIKKIIHLSSVGVVGMQYSRKRVIVDEHHPCRPRNNYERTKLEAERSLLEFASGSPVQLHILRPTNVFGDHHPRRALLRLLTKIREGGSFPLMTGAAVNYVYVKDVAAAIRHFLHQNGAGQVVNVGESMPLHDFLQLAAETSGRVLKTMDLSPAFFALPGSMLKGPLARLKGLSNRVEYSDTYMRTHIGYPYGLRTGLERTVKFYLDQRLLR